MDWVINEDGSAYSANGRFDVIDDGRDFLLRENQGELSSTGDSAYWEVIGAFETIEDAQDAAEGIPPGDRA